MKVKVLLGTSAIVGWQIRRKVVFRDHKSHVSEGHMAQESALLSRR